MDYTIIDELDGPWRDPTYPRPLFHARLEARSRERMRMKYRRWRTQQRTRWFDTRITGQIYRSTPRSGPSIFEQFWNAPLAVRVTNQAALDITELEGRRFSDICTDVLERAR